MWYFEINILIIVKNKFTSNQGGLNYDYSNNYIIQIAWKGFGLSFIRFIARPFWWTGFPQIN